MVSTELYSRHTSVGKQRHSGQSVYCSFLLRFVAMVMVPRWSWENQMMVLEKNKKIKVGLVIGKYDFFFFFFLLTIKYDKV